jgi:hypothetical protein
VSIFVSINFNIQKLKSRYYLDIYFDLITQLLVQATWAVQDLHNSYILEGLAEVEFCADKMYVFMQSIPVEIQTPKHWNLIGCSMIVLLPLVSHSSILSALLSCRVLFPQGKIWHVSQMYYSGTSNYGHRN